MKKLQSGKSIQQNLGKSSSIQILITATNTVRAEIINALNQNDMSSAHTKYQNYIQSLSSFQSIDKQVLSVAQLSIQYFFFQLTAEGQFEAEIEKQLIRKLEKLPKLMFVWDKIKEGLILASSAIQLQLKHILNNQKKVTSIADLIRLEEITRQMVKIHPISKRYAKQIMTILINLRIYKLNISVNHQQKLIQFCEMMVNDQRAETRLLTLQTKVTLLYNCLKILVGERATNERQEKSLQKLYEALRIKSVCKYEQHLLHIFFCIKGLIFQRGKSMEGGQAQGSSDEQEEKFLESGAEDKLSNWTSVSLDETSLALEEASRSIIRHRVASLATIIEMKLSLPQFCLNFLELMHDGPFNNEAQTIKLCFQFFEAREFQKLNSCLQAVLSSPSCKNLREREVLVSMCAIYTGQYLRDRQSALLYAKLNHHQSKKLILREETLLQQIGFAYLNLAKYQQYVCNRQVFEIQALHTLKASASVNPHNYLTQYCLGKLLLKMGDLENAYNHSKESLMSGRGQWMPYSLLACVYFCQRRFSKASTIIDELLKKKKYKNAKQLYYIQAYLEVNHLLLEVEHDQQVQAAKELGDDIYDITRDRVLKNKSPLHLLRYLQEYHQYSLGLNSSIFDQNYFYNSPVFSNLQMGIQTFAIGYQQVEGEQTILQILPLLLQAGQINIVQGLIKSLPSSPSKTYQLALLHEAKGQKATAIAEYKSVISQQPYHTDSLINLSLLVDDIADALHYIDIAEKFTIEPKLCLAKGILLSQKGNIEQAHQLFLKENETGWLEIQPDLIYYY